MKWNLSKIELSESEKIWLHEVYQLFLRNHFKPDITMLKRKLMLKLDSNFDQNKINNFLLRYGKELTPLGVYYFDPKTKVFTEIDNLLNTIKREISINEISNISVKDLSKITNFSLNKINQLLFLISSLGFRFWSGAGLEKNGHYIYLNLDREDVIDEYINFKNINKLIKERFIANLIFENRKFQKPKVNVINHSIDFVNYERLISLKEIKKSN